MQYDIERRRRENIHRKRRRARQIRRRVCFVGIICIIALVGVIVGVVRQKKRAADIDKPCECVETLRNISYCRQRSERSRALQIADSLSEVTAAVPRDPVFVCLPVPMSEEEQRIVFDICADNGVAFSFIMAIIGEESEFEREARSVTGDSGYMQINDCNAAAIAERGFVDMYDTAQNVGAGVSIIRDLFDTYGDDEVHRVLMAYNMGTGNAAELWAQGIETSEYSREVVKREAEYSRYMDEHLKGY